MTIAWIQFSEQLAPWSEWTFWVVLVSVILTLGFTVAVFIGGLGDLRYLLRALGEEEIDKNDDGRVITPPADVTPDASPAEKVELAVHGRRVDGAD